MRFRGIINKSTILLGFVAASWINLGPDNCINAQTSGNPTAQATVEIAAASPNTHAQSSGTPILTEIVTLASNSASNVTFAADAMVVRSIWGKIITEAGDYIITEAGDYIITESYYDTDIFPENISNSQLISQSSLVETVSLVSASPNTHEQSSASPNINLGFIVSPDTATNATASVSSSLTFTYQLASNNCSQTTNSSSPTIVQIGDLFLDNTSNSQNAASPAIIASVPISCDNSSHIHSVQSTNLPTPFIWSFVDILKPVGKKYPLRIRAAHGSSLSYITPNNCSNAHIATSSPIVQIIIYYNLSIFGGNHIQTSGIPTLAVSPGIDSAINSQSCISPINEYTILISPNNAENVQIITVSNVIEIISLICANGNITTIASESSINTNINVNVANCINATSCNSTSISEIFSYFTIDSNNCSHIQIITQPGYTIVIGAFSHILKPATEMTSYFMPRPRMGGYASLNPNDCTIGQICDPAIIQEIVSSSPTNCAHATLGLSPVIVSGNFIINPDNGSNGHFASLPEISGQFSPFNAINDQTTTESVVNQFWDGNFAQTTITQSAESPSVIQYLSGLAADCQHNQTAGTSSVQEIVTFDPVWDRFHIQTATSPALKNWFDPNNCIVITSCSSPQVIEKNVIIVGSTNDQSCTSPVLLEIVAIICANDIHSQLISSPIIGTGLILEPNICIHNTASGNVTVSHVQTIIPNNASHAQMASLSYFKGSISPNACSHVQAATISSVNIISGVKWIFITKDRESYFITRNREIYFITKV